MNHEQLAKLEQAINESEHALLFNKNADYASKEDALSNFKQLAKLLGTSPEQILIVYLMKHISSILRYVRDKKLSSEPIESRIHDVRVYMLLLAALIEDGAQKPTGVVQ